jgi:hypothetical protein
MNNKNLQNKNNAPKVYISSENQVGERGRRIEAKESQKDIERVL